MDNNVNMGVSFELNKLVIKNRFTNTRLYKLIKFSYKYVLIFSFLFYFGNLEHPDTLYIDRFFTSILHFLMIIIMFNLIKFTLKDLKEDIKYIFKE